MSSPRRAIRVPLAVDAQFRLPVGSLLLPIRSLLLVAAMAPLAYTLLAIGLPGMWGAAGAGFILAVAASLGLPERQGVWLGTDAAYRLAWRVMPSVVTRGRASRARVRAVNDSVHVSPERPRVAAPRWMSSGWRSLFDVPTTSTEATGILRLDPGGHRVLLVLEGPAVSVASDRYLEWCRAVLSWVMAAECPAQSSR
jgi:hypothetical protein